MHERPQGDLVDALTAAGSAPPLPLTPPPSAHFVFGQLYNPPRCAGAAVKYLGKHGCLPVQVIGCSLQAGDLHVATKTSSQFLSGLLMAAAVSGRKGSVTVKSAGESVVSEPYVLYKYLYVRVLRLRRARHSFKIVS